MPKIFVSYSRADHDRCVELVRRLRRIYGADNVWFDDEIHGGDDWWTLILERVAWCDVFIYLLSRESLESDYCKAELAEAERLNKTILPVLIRTKTNPPANIRKYQWIDAANGISVDVMTEIPASIARLQVNEPDRTPPPRRLEPTPPPTVPERDKNPTRGRASVRLIEIVGVLLAFAALVVGVLQLVAATNGANTATPTTQPQIVVVPTDAPTQTNTPDIMVTPTTQTQIVVVPTDAPTQTNTPDIMATILVNDTATRNAEIAAYTPTFTNTPVPTENYTATTAAIYTQRAEQTSVSATQTQAAAPTLSGAYALAQAGITSNDSWTPSIEQFNGISMALAPTGCFMMGSNGNADEQPVHEQCFNEPFWIDVTEVTNAAYGSFGYFLGASLPRDSVTWFEARDFCAARGENVRLPTEREWEYAARGVDNLIYPWGDTFVAENVVYGANSNNSTADVGSRPNATSWVGALDMSGNVWEWVSSLYLPYQDDRIWGDNREDGENRTDVRVVRGGSWFNTVTSLRGASRSRGFVGNVNDYLGFRCARSP